MKTLVERLRAARFMEVGLLIVALAILGLMMLNAGSNAREDVRGTSLEIRLARLLQQIDGVGRVNVMIAQDDDGAVTGVVIVAGGLSDVRTCLEIESAVQALLGVDLDHIRIIGSQNVRGGKRET